MRWVLTIFSGFMILFTTFAVLFVVFTDNNSQVDNKPSQIQLTCATVTDSVEAYCTFPVTISLSDKKHVKALDLRIEGNRLWTRPDSSFAQFESKIILPVSFNDTGIKQIRCCGRLDSGDSVIIEKNIYVYLPLFPALNFKGADSIVFSTTPVKDSVVYVWQFEDGPFVYSEKPQIVFSLNELKSASGTLYVTDNHTQSAVKQFSFKKADNENTDFLTGVSVKGSCSARKAIDSLNSDSRSIRIVRDTVVFHDTVFINDTKSLCAKKSK